MFCGTCFNRQESHKQLDDEVDLEAEIEEEMRQEELLRAERSHELRLQKQRIIAVSEVNVMYLICRLITQLHARRRS